MDLIIVGALGFPEFLLESLTLLFLLVEEFSLTSHCFFQLLPRILLVSSISVFIFVTEISSKYQPRL